MEKKKKRQKKRKEEEDNEEGTKRGTPSSLSHSLFLSPTALPYPSFLTQSQLREREKKCGGGKRL